MRRLSAIVAGAILAFGATVAHGQQTHTQAELQAQQQQAIDRAEREAITERSQVPDHSGEIAVAIIVTPFVIYVLWKIWYDFKHPKSPWYQETRPDGQKVWVRKPTGWVWFIRF